jgi:dienelactone hydrolase
MNADGFSEVIAIAHPGLVTKNDLDKLKTPTCFLLAEVDSSFKPDIVQYAQQAVQKTGIPAKFTTYPGTCHGFASRGNLKIGDVKKGFEGHLIESVEWFKRYME